MPAPKPLPTSHARRAPMQERSNDTVNQIFDATSALLSRMPIEDITTSRIAQEAGVSIGGLYRFFPDKQSILDAIAVRHIQDFQQQLEARLAEQQPPSGPACLELAIDVYVDFLDARPDFRTIALGRHVSDKTRREQIEPNVGPAALLKRFLTARFGAEDSPFLNLKLRIITEAGERLIAYAFAQETRAERDRVISEMKRLTAQYLA